VVAETRPTSPLRGTPPGRIFFPEVPSRVGRSRVATTGVGSGWWPRPDPPPPSGVLLPVGDFFQKSPLGRGGLA
ncbi:MAG: hypothetical protein AAGG51_28990, partial [Cyanobacteria bacterium P01_G01_bin.54]